MAEASVRGSSKESNELSLQIKRVLGQFDKNYNKLGVVAYMATLNSKNHVKHLGC